MNPNKTATQQPQAGTPKPGAPAQKPGAPAQKPNPGQPGKGAPSAPPKKK